jgi:ParB family chromosome partitioning protein
MSRTPQGVQPGRGAAPVDPSGFIQVPLSRLVPSARNVRKTSADSLGELAASILAHGLLQNLNVTPEIGPDGQPTGHYEVIAGARRLAALTQLAKEQRLPNAFPVPCRVVAAGNAQESSLAENVVRQPMHPADQFEAFRALVEQGFGAEEVAARFGVTPTVVQRRLRLARVSPRLFELYRRDEITLEQLMALAVCEDHARQERVWDSAQDWQRDPHDLRAALTEDKINAATDPRARFVGVKAYLDAGGQVERDLFEDEGHAGYLTDAALLDRLTGEKLAELGEAIRQEGWKWVEVCARFDYAQLADFGHVHTAPMAVSAADEAEIETLEAERDRIYDDHEGVDEYPEAVSARLREINARLGELQQVWDYRPEDKAQAGAIVCLRHDGAFVYRGLLRAEDRPQATSGEPGQSPDLEDALKQDETPAFSGALIEDLTAERTAAMRATLINRPDVALLAIAHHLAVQTFYASYHAPSALELAVTPDAAILARHAAEIEPTRAGKALEDKRAFWASCLPQTAAELWGWLGGQNQTVILELLAYCVAQAVNAVQLPHQRPTEPRLAAAHRLAEALALDMADWWQPTAANFFMRVKREQAIEAVVEATGAKDVIALGKLKKSELAAEAEKRLTACRWLPRILKP